MKKIFFSLCLLPLFASTARAQTRPADGNNTAVAQPAAQVSAGFPKDIPVPREAKPSNAMVRGDGTRRLVLDYEGRVESAVSYYTKELAGRGWSLTLQRSRGGAASLLAEKGSRSVAVGIFDRKGMVQISIEADPEYKK